MSIAAGQRRQWLRFALRFALLGMLVACLFATLQGLLILNQPLTLRLYSIPILSGMLVGFGVGWGYYTLKQHEQELNDTAAALRQSEARQRALLEAIPDAIVRLNRAGVYLEIQAPTDFMAVLPIARMLGKRQSEVLPPAMAAQFKTNIAQALATQQLQTFEYTALVDGEQRQREARVVPVNQEEVIAILRDITTRKQVEHALRQSEARYRALIEAIPDAITRIRGHGLYLDAKPPTDFTAVTDLAQVIGQKVQDVLPPMMAHKLMHHIRLALHSGQIQTFEIEVEVEGQRRLREIRVVPSGADEVTTIARDFTALREAEALRQRTPIDQRPL